MLLLFLAFQSRVDHFYQPMLSAISEPAYQHTFTPTSHSYRRRSHPYRYCHPEATCTPHSAFQYNPFLSTYTYNA